MPETLVVVSKVKKIVKDANDDPEPLDYLRRLAREGR